MTDLLPQYRTRIYAQRSVDETEATILTPAAGAVHSENCQIATIPDLVGYKNLLGIPEGRRSRFDPLTRDIERGALYIPIKDYKVTPGGSEAERWFTAFLGDAQGRLQCFGSKVITEWRLDPAAAWDPYYVTRVKDVDMQGIIPVGLRTGDLLDDLDYDLCSERPHPNATGVVTPSLLPFGLTADYGPVKAYNGKVINGTGRMTGVLKSSGPNRYIDFVAETTSRSDNILSARLVKKSKTKLYLVGLSIGAAAGAGGLRVRFSSTSPAISEKEVVPTRFEFVHVDGDPPRCTRIHIAAAPTNDPYYQAIDTGSLPNNSVITFDVREDTDPTVFVQAHPVRLLADILDGYYGPLRASTAGNPPTVTRKVARNSASFTTLLADATIPIGRFRLEKGNALKWITENILQPYELGLRVNESGELVVFSTKLPTDLGSLPVITDPDLLRARIGWKGNGSEAITQLVVEAVQETLIPLSKVGTTGKDTFPDLPVGLIEESIAALADVDFGDARNFKPKSQTIRASGLRYIDGEVSQGVSKQDSVEAYAGALVNSLRPIYGCGTQRISFICRRNAVPVALQPGQWCLLNSVHGPPNTSTNTRGGLKLILITSRTEQNLGLEFEGIDAGPGSLASPPTIGTPTQEAGNTQYGFEAAITLNASSDPVTVWACYTPTSVGSRPPLTDERWHLVAPLANYGNFLDFLVRTPATHQFRVNPPGVRVWVGARTEAKASGGASKLPSAMVYPSGTGYVDLDPIGTPASVSVTNITLKSAKVSWTNTEPNLRMVVLLGQGASSGASDASTAVVVSPQLPAGSTFFDLSLSGGPYYKAEVAYLDAWGNLGPHGGTTPQSFHPTASPLVAPTPAAMIVTRDSSHGIQPAQGSDWVQIGRYGSEFSLVPGPKGNGYDAKIYRADDSGGVSGTYALYRTIGAIQLQAAGYLWADLLPNDGLRRWYKFLLSGSGVDDGDYCQEVSAIPGFLGERYANASPGEPYLGAEDPPIWITPGDLGAEDTSGPDYIRNLPGAVLAPLAANQTIVMRCGVTVPAGRVIIGFEARGWRFVSGDSWNVQLEEIDDSPSTNVLSALSIASPGVGYQTSSDLALGAVVDGTKRYEVQVTLKGNTGGTNARFAWARILTRRTSYAQ